MQAIIADNRWVYIDQIIGSIEPLIIDYFSAKHPRSHFIDTAQQRWDGWYRKYDERHSRINRALLNELRKFAKEYKLPFEIKDLRDPVELDPQFTDDMLPGITLAEYQMDALKAMHPSNNEVGVISVPTGGGKTELMAAVTKAYNLTTVIVADQRIVIEQIKERLELRDVVNDGVGLFYGGSRPNGQTVIVGSIQSLTTPPASLKRKDPKQWKKRYQNAKAFQELVKAADLLLVDECVHPSTLIETSEGLIRASEVVKLLQKGMPIKAKNFGKYDPIIGFKYVEAKPTVSVVTHNNHNVITSDDHEFAVWEDRRLTFKCANQLNKGDLLLLTSEIKKFHIDESWYLLGLFVGDGHFVNNKQIKFGISKDIEFWNTVGRRFVNCFGGNYNNYFNSRGDLIVRVRSPNFIAWIKSIGFSPGRKVGSMKTNFDVGKPSEAAGFVKGLLDSEGSIYDHQIKIGMTDYQIIKRIQECLTFLGICSSIFRDNSKHNLNRNHARQWVNTITGQNIYKFLARIMPDIKSKKLKAQKSIKISRRKETIYDPRVYIDFAEKQLKLKPKTISKMMSKAELTRMRCGKDKLDANRIFEFLENLKKLSVTKIGSYNDAKKYFDITWKDVAKWLNKPISTIYKQKPPIKDWDGLIMAKKQKIIKFLEQGDENKVLPYYRTVKFKELKPAGKSKLIDFAIKDSHVFNANGFLVHNCDKATDKRYRAMFMKYFNGRYKFGFSGTPFDEAKPVEALILKEHLGSIIYDIPRKVVEQAGRIIPIHAIMIAAGECGDKRDRTAYDIAQRELIIENDEYHQRIKMITDGFPDDRTLVLVDTNNVEDLGKILQEKIDGSIFIYGKTSTKKRRQALDAFENGELKVLIGGKILKRGLDIKGGVHNLIICGGGKLHSDFDQKVGRAVRINDRGFARLFCFFHLDNYYLYKHSKEQLKSIINMGYDAQVVVNGTTIDGRELIKRRFRLPKS